MAYICYKRLWETEFVDIASKKDKMQDINLNQIKLKVHDTYKKDEKLKNFEAINDEDVINKTYLDEKIENWGPHINIKKRLQRI